jgi:hypothetical protein
MSRQQKKRDYEVSELGVAKAMADFEVSLVRKFCRFAWANNKHELETLRGIGSDYYANVYSRCASTGWNFSKLDDPDAMTSCIDLLLESLDKDEEQAKKEAEEEARRIGAHLFDLNASGHLENTHLAWEDAASNFVKQ